MSVILLDHQVEKPKSNLRLFRLCEWAGFRYEDFRHITLTDDNLAWPHLPPGPSTVLAMGPRATAACEVRLALDDIRGYVFGRAAARVIPTVGPGFIQRGNAKYSAAFINDLQKAVSAAQGGIPATFTKYVLDPSPLGAYEWAKGYIAALEREPSTYLAFDIETPGKGDDEEGADSTGDAPDRTWHIDRIGFAFRPYEALSIPWSPPYVAAIRMLLGSVGPKVVWNQGFDVPRVRRAGVSIEGLIHDGMVAWHILHSDLPKRLGFVATFTCPWQPAWKHLSGAQPAFYNATDADVELRSMLRIEEELRKNGMWEVYQRDVLDLQPVLDHMERVGMPIDVDIRIDRAIRLAGMLAETRGKMEAAVPLEARRIAIVYKSTPKDLTGLLSRPGTRTVPVCSQCGCEKPRKDHFKRFVRKVNPCTDAQSIQRTVTVEEYFRLAEFTPSRDQLIRYHQLLKRPCPTTYDKKTRKQKVSFAEKQVKELRIKYKDDILYELILQYRSLDKLSGTYIGRPVHSEEAT